VLLVRAGGRTCALPIAHVIETMRPLPVAPLSGTPPFVKGVAVIRGGAAPVVDLGAFLGAGATAASRFVLVRCGARNAALAVESVIGVARFAGGEARATPLVAGACAGAVELLGALDQEMLLVLRAVAIVPEGVWRAVDAPENEQ
jgi:purine-binding chemotaxis protein CheW